MNIRNSQSGSQRGIALIMVMIVITALGILAGGFAYSMKVETQLARNASFDSELEWLGRSGVELARYVLGQTAAGPGGQMDAVNQKWAGGVGNTNDPLNDINLDHFEIGRGVVSVKITDMDRKFNINYADETILRQALILVGVDAASFPTIIDSILDWRDQDDDSRMSGAESQEYESKDPPYFAKNGPFDDINELLLVNGITPAMVWGANSSTRAAIMNRPASRSNFEEPSYVVGLADLFCTVSGPRVNANTASATVLQMVPEVDENIAAAIITARAGPDGVEGNEDDMPFRSAADLTRVPGIPPQAVQLFTRYFHSQSLVFEVKVEAQIASAKRSFTALVQRSGRNTQVLTFYWK